MLELPIDRIIKKWRYRLLRAKSIEFVHIYYEDEDSKNPYRIWIVWKPNIYTKSWGVALASLESLERFIKEVLLDDKVRGKIKELKDELNIIKGK